MANAISVGVMDSNAIFFGKNSRINPFMFSLAPLMDLDNGNHQRFEVAVCGCSCRFLFRGHNQVPLNYV